MPKPTIVPQAFSTEPRPLIAMDSVESSQVKAIGYCDATQTLAVTFTRGTGAIYCYPNVSRATFEEFKAAESIGAYFGQHIKSLPFAKYPATAETREAA